MKLSFQLSAWGFKCGHWQHSQHAAWYFPGSFRPIPAPQNPVPHCFLSAVNTSHACAHKHTHTSWFLNIWTFEAVFVTFNKLDPCVVSVVEPVLRKDLVLHSWVFSYGGRDVSHNHINGKHKRKSDHTNTKATQWKNNHNRSAWNTQKGRTVLVFLSTSVVAHFHCSCVSVFLAFVVVLLLSWLCCVFCGCTVAFRVVFSLLRLCCIRTFSATGRLRISWVIEDTSHLFMHEWQRSQWHADVTQVFSNPWSLSWQIPQKQNLMFTHFYRKKKIIHIKHKKHSAPTTTLISMFLWPLAYNSLFIPQVMWLVAFEPCPGSRLVLMILRVMNVGGVGGGWGGGDKWLAHFSIWCSHQYTNRSWVSG